MDKTALVVGASGFLGRYLADACFERNWKLFGIDPKPPLEPGRWEGFEPSTLEGVDLAEFLPDGKLDVCFFLGGSASVPLSVQNPLHDFQKLLPGLVRVLSYLGRHQPGCRLVLYSSAAVYGNPLQLPVSEKAPVVPVSPYGIHKALAEELIRHYTTLYPIKASVLRIFSAYGEGLQKQLFWDVIQKYRHALARHEGTFPMWGTGAESRDFLHAADVALAALAVAEHQTETFQVVNVARGEETTVADAVGMLLAGAHPVVTPVFGGEGRAGDPLNWRADVSVLKSLGWKPSVGMAEGMARYYEWSRKVSDANESSAK